MKNAIVAFGLISLLAMSLAWASDFHGIIKADRQDAVHHHESGSAQASTLDACHVFHCQASTHLSSIPPSGVLVVPPMPVAVANGDNLSTLVGIAANIIRPPIA